MIDYTFGTGIPVTSVNVIIVVTEIHLVHHLLLLLIQIKKPRNPGPYFIDKTIQYSPFTSGGNNKSNSMQKLLLTYSHFDFCKGIVFTV